jgi:multiple sugar transport system substrate-binding protein
MPSCLPVNYVHCYFSPHSGSALVKVTPPPLNVWIRASNDSKNIYKQEAEKFEEKTGIKIAYFNATTDFEQRLARATAGNALPDLIFNDAASLGQFIQLGIAEEIDPQAIAGGDQLFQTAWKSTRYIDGKYYGVPTSAQTFALFVRKDWREKLGLPQPKSWDDIQTLAKAFTTRIPMVTAKMIPTALSFPLPRRAATPAGL